MSRAAYRRSAALADVASDFETALMTAMRLADSEQADRLRVAFPAVWVELQARYREVGGRLPTDPADVRPAAQPAPERTP